MGPTRKPRTSAQTHNWSGIDYHGLTLNQSCTTFRKFNHQYRVHHGVAQNSVRRPPGVAQNSGTRTLRSSLASRCLQLDSIISKIHGSNYTAISSPRLKHCNASISMRAVVNGVKYHSMAILTIKWHDLGGYKENITCKSCGYADPKYPPP